MDTVSLPCLRCSAPVEVLAIWQGAASHGVVCETCAEREQREQREREAKRDLAHKWDWELCPTRFQDTRLEKLPCQRKTQEAMLWPASASRGQGLNLWGWPDTGKTRTLYLILKREHFNGRSIIVFGPGEFTIECERRDFKRAPWVTRLCAVDLLAFDDFDKMNLSTEMEKTFFGIVDKRLSNMKPCLFTHNSNGEQITHKFRLGEPLARRMRQFCQHVHFGNPTKPDTIRHDDFTQR